MTDPEGARRPMSTTAEIATVDDGAIASIAGQITGVTRKTTKQGRPWAVVTLQTPADGLEVMFFPNVYEIVGQYLEAGAVVIVKSRVNRRGLRPRLLAMDLWLVDGRSRAA